MRMRGEKITLGSEEMDHVDDIISVLSPNFQAYELKSVIQSNLHCAEIIDAS